MKGLLTELGMNTFTIVAMLISMAAFIGILIWVLTRSQSEIDAQAKLYEEGEPTAKEIADETENTDESKQP